MIRNCCYIWIIDMKQSNIKLEKYKLMSQGKLQTGENIYIQT